MWRELSGKADNFRHNYKKGCRNKMTVTEIKHAAKRQEWQEKIMECRGSGEPVQRWCSERQISPTTYYRWEREIFGRVGQKGKGIQTMALAAPEFVEAPAVRPCSTPGQAIMTLRVGTMEADIYTGAGINEIEAVCRVLKQC